MKITNTTKWNTSDLRRLFSKCIKEIKRTEKRGWNSGLHVKISNRSQGISGRAYIGRYRMMLKIGVDVDLEKREKRDRLAQVFIHEYYHNLGYRSQDRMNYTKDWTKKTNISFVRDCYIRRAVAEEKPKRDLQMERYQNVLQYVKMWESKAKRAKNVLKKWRLKQRYYERTLVAAGKIEKSK